MRIAILCNDRLALPGLEYLIHTKQAVAIGMPTRVSETQRLVHSRCKQAKIPFQLFGKKDLAPAIIAWLIEHRPDVVFVKTFPYLIPPEVLSLPVYGFINFHYAPLPEWRGPNPLFWMLRNDEKTGGVTVHEMSSGYDEGPILLEQPVPIGHNINFGILNTQLAHAGLQLTIQLVNDFATVLQHRKKQDHSKAGWYDHPKETDLFIDWQTMTAAEILALVKACNPWNKGAATRWKGWTFGITYASVGELLAGSIYPGTILSIDASTGLTIVSKDHKVVVAEVVYCEEGYYPGYCLSAFGLQKNDILLT
jgi:methionyl-tRNA formyltransferase